MPQAAALKSLSVLWFPGKVMHSWFIAPIQVCDCVFQVKSNIVFVMYKIRWLCRSNHTSDFPLSRQNPEMTETISLLGTCSELRVMGLDGTGNLATRSPGGDKSFLGPDTCGGGPNCHCLNAGAFWRTSSTAANFWGPGAGALWQKRFDSNPLKISYMGLSVNTAWSSFWITLIQNVLR